MLVVGAAGPACTTPEEPAAPPTYTENVAAVLDRACAGCHRDGGLGPMALDSYGAAAEHADAIAQVTATRTMPPWPADSSGACNTFVGQRWLTDAEIELLAGWARAGAPRGAARSTSPAPAPTVTFDRTVTLGPPAPVPIPPLTDTYRCFVVDPALAEDRFITAMAVDLDRADVVHHVQLYAIDDDETADEVAVHDAADPLPGYACGNESFDDALRYVGVWAPGDVVRRWAAGTGIALRAHRKLLLQIHYHNHAAQPVVDQTHIGLELADRVDAQGDVLRARNSALVLPPGLPNVVAVGTHVLDLDGPATARGFRIHMHQLGASGRLELVRDGETRCLLSIPRWDFDWQLFYMLDEPIALSPGDQLRLTCTYDTRSQTQTVRWGTSTDDEMCIGYTYATR